MKLAVRFIYYKAAASKVLTLDMPQDDWSRFFCSTPTEQKMMLCQLAGYNPSDYLKRIRIAAWIPLSDQYEIIEKQQN